MATAKVKKQDGMMLAKVKEQDGMMLAKVKEQDGMMLAKVKEQDGMILAKVKEQDGIMLANVKVPSIPTSAACCDDVQLTNAKSSSYTFYNRQLLIRPCLPKHIYLFIYNFNYFIGLRPPNTDTSSYLQLSTTSSDCVLQTQIPLIIYNCQLLHRTASSKHRYL